MQAQQVLRQRFPGMEVVPSTYPVSAQKVGCLVHVPRASEAHPHLYHSPHFVPYCKRWVDRIVIGDAKLQAVLKAQHGRVLADLPG